jgi:hypothetical protein
VQSHASLESVEGGLTSLAAWCLTSDKIKLADLAEMTEGGTTHPLFITVLQVSLQPNISQRITTTGLWGLIEFRSFYVLF